MGYAKPAIRIVTLAAVPYLRYLYPDQSHTNHGSDLTIPYLRYLYPEPNPNSPLMLGSTLTLALSLTIALHATTALTLSITTAIISLLDLSVMCSHVQSYIIACWTSASTEETLTLVVALLAKRECVVMCSHVQSYIIVALLARGELG